MYSVTLGTLEELGLDAEWNDPSLPAMALQVERANAESQLLLVPGTAGPERESSVFVAMETATETIFLIWEERNNIHSQVKLISYRDNEWSEPIRVSDQRLSLKTAPSFAVTRDGFATNASDGSPYWIHRTIVHAVWLEERGEGSVVVYSPITLLDGEFAGNPQMIDITDYLRPEAEAAIPAADHSFTPVVVHSEADNAVVIGAYDPWNHSVATFRVAVLSADISAIANGVAEFIRRDLDIDLADPESIASLADDMRGHMIDIGARMNPEILNPVADEMRGHMIDIGFRFASEGRDGVARLADGMRGHMIDIGFRLDDRGLQHGGENRSVVDLIAYENASVSHVAEISEKRRMGLPENLPLTGTGALQLYVSENGKQAVLAEEAEDGLVYREWEGQAWSDTHRLIFSESFDLDAARAILRTRLAN